MMPPARASPGFAAELEQLAELPTDVQSRSMNSSTAP
jgi:hypothetical protein